MTRGSNEVLREPLTRVVQAATKAASGEGYDMGAVIYLQKPAKEGEEFAGDYALGSFAFQGIPNSHFLHVISKMLQLLAAVVDSRLDLPEPERQRLWVELCALGYAGQPKDIGSGNMDRDGNQEVVDDGEESP